MDHKALCSATLICMKEKIIEAGENIYHALNNDKPVLFFGNGGSAADAMHWAAELSGKFLKERRPLNAIALCNPSALTAIANDYGIDEVFARQVGAHGQKGGVAVGITASGMSRNIYAAFKEARKYRMVTIMFVGSGVGNCKDHADVVITIPSQDVPRIQEMHELCGHIICEYVENRIAEKH